MAIPTLLRQTDYAGVDFTDKAQGTFEVLKDALVDKFGWTLLFEDLASPNKSFVVANTGSQSCLKITKEDGDTSYLKFEAAQSYSDINTPVNAIQSCYYPGYFNLLFYIIGDSQRFYFCSYENENINTNSSSISGFCGDFKPFTENNPNIFILTPSRSNSPQFDGGKSLSNRGVLGESYLAPYMPNGEITNAYGNIYNLTSEIMVLISPGNAAYISVSDNINITNPLILSNLYIAGKSKNQNNELVFYGALSGVNYCVTPNSKITNKNRGEDVLIGGVSGATLPDTVNGRYNKGVILLNDWDVL